MSALKDQLQSDLSRSIKARDQVRTAALRMGLAAIRTEEVAGKSARELSDEEVIAVLRKEAKKRDEAAEAFSSGGRTEQAEKERLEGAIFAEYLPAELSEDELQSAVADAITETGAEGPKGMGMAMKVLRPKVGDRVDGSRLAEEVRRQLLAS